MTEKPLYLITRPVSDELKLYLKWDDRRLGPWWSWTTSRHLAERFDNKLTQRFKSAFESAQRDGKAQVEEL
jgi:hypothetical protein